MGNKMCRKEKYLLFLFVLDHYLPAFRLYSAVDHKNSSSITYFHNIYAHIQIYSIYLSRNNRIKTQYLMNDYENIIHILRMFSLFHKS